MESCKDFGVGSPIRRDSNSDNKEEEVTLILQEVGFTLKEFIKENALFESKTNSFNKKI